MKPNNYKKWGMIVAITVLGVLCVIGLFMGQSNPANVSDLINKANQVSQGALISSSAACRDCHQAIYENYIKTGHFLTSTPAVNATILGSFSDGDNVVQTQLPELSFRMETRVDSFFQTAVYARRKIIKYAQPFDVVVGSGERAQSYFYWEKDRLFQLPVTYVTPTDNWILSPGYDDRIISWQYLPDKKLSMFYQRPVGARCLECHANAVRPTKPPIGFHFIPDSFEFGIGCEKCHGPGADHITFHQKNPGQEEGVHIVNPAHLSRSQQLSSCALCHAGQGVAKTPPLSFRPGDEISAHRLYSKKEQKKMSVHGGQVPFLEESRCFLESSTMTCSTCHNVHEDQTDLVDLFSTKCLNCHQQSHLDKPALAHGNQCTKCHMPDQQATNLTMFHEGDQFFLSMANHRIGIFEEE